MRASYFARRWIGQVSLGFDRSRDSAPARSAAQTEAARGARARAGAGGALSRICVPASGWNGDLFLWAHGYVAFNEPLDFYHLTLADGTSLPSVVQGLGYAFATTSYRQNGLAILEGASDVGELSQRAADGA